MRVVVRGCVLQAARALLAVQPREHDHTLALLVQVAPVCLLLVRLLLLHDVKPGVRLAITQSSHDPVALHERVHGDQRDVQEKHQHPLEPPVLELCRLEAEHEAEAVAPEGDGENEGHQVHEGRRPREEGQEVEPGDERQERADGPGDEVAAEVSSLPQGESVGQDAKPETREPSCSLLPKVVDGEGALLEHPSSHPVEPHALPCQLHRKVRVLRDAAHHAPVPPDVLLQLVAADDEGAVHADEGEAEELVLQPELGVVVGESDGVRQRCEVVFYPRPVVEDHSLPDARVRSSPGRHEHLLLHAVLEDVLDSLPLELRLLVKVNDPVVPTRSAGSDGEVEGPSLVLAAARRAVVGGDDDLSDGRNLTEVDPIVCDHLHLPPALRQPAALQHRDGRLAVGEDEVRVVAPRDDAEEKDEGPAGAEDGRALGAFSFDLIVDRGSGLGDDSRVEEQASKTLEESRSREQEDPGEAGQDLCCSSTEFDDVDPGIDHLSQTEGCDEDDKPEVVEEQLVTGRHLLLFLLARRQPAVEDAAQIVGRAPCQVVGGSCCGKQHKRIAQPDDLVDLRRDPRHDRPHHRGHQHDA
eukprot:756786-Hanusia_phi.AAC.4